MYGLRAVAIDGFLTDPKEPNYFSVERRWERGQDWYESLFAGAAEGQVAGEASTAYTRWPISRYVPERIDALYPFARFVYIMRHPVERAFSHYALNVQRKGLPLTFEEALAERKRYVIQGLYMSQIDRFLRHFTRDRFLFLLLEDLKADPESVFEELQRFVGVEVRDLTEGRTSAANRGGDVPVASRRLTRFLRATASLPGLAAISGHVRSDNTWPRRSRAQGLHAFRPCNRGDRPPGGADASGDAGDASRHVPRGYGAPGGLPFPRPVGLEGVRDA